MEAQEASPSKAGAVNALVESILNHRVVGIASVEGIPGPQLQQMRRKLRGRVTLKVAKNRLLSLALQRASAQRRGLEGLGEVIQGQSALVVSDQNPFKLFKELEGTKGNAPARGGEAAPDDIWIRSGETPFKPGPVVGELQKAGIPAAIDRGKVIIRQDKLLVKRGERIPREVASVLTRLEIYPLIVGLDLRGAFEEGTLFRRDALAVDEARVRADLMTASRSAFNLAMYAWIPTPITARPLMTKAHLQALALAARAGYVSKATAPVLLGAAQARALRLAALLGSKEPKALDEGILRRLEGAARPVSPEVARGEKKEEKKEEEKVSEEEAAAGLGSLFG